MCFGLFLGEHILAYSAKRALEILGKILKLGSGSDTALGISGGLVIDPATSVTNILFHNKFLQNYILQYQ